jgi:hypothetical protein
MNDRHTIKQTKKETQMRKIDVRWIANTPAGGMAVDKWEVLIVVGETEITLTEGEAGALVNQIDKMIDTPLNKRRTY